METVKMPTGKWEIVRIGKMGDAIRRIRLPHPPYDSEAEANEAAREEKEKEKFFTLHTELPLSFRRQSALKYELLLCGI